MKRRQLRWRLFAAVVIPFPGGITLTAVMITLLSAWGSAFAGELETATPRSLGLGGALRGAATGAAGPTLNPSGISLVRSYAIEGSYANSHAEAGHVAQLSIVDSTSAFNLGGGVYYTYATASPKNAPGIGRHEGGLLLSFPFGDRVSIGGTVRYIRARQDAIVGASPVPARLDKGFTFDAGLTVRPISFLSLGLVGYGLRDMKNPQVPFAAGGGLALVPVPELVVVLDGLIDFRSHDESLGSAKSIMGGVEYTFASRYAIRAGGGHDGGRKQDYTSAGASLLSEAGALDLGARQDVTGEDKGFFIGIAGRLFVPAP
jgi:hypothetical protein